MYLWVWLLLFDNFNVQLYLDGIENNNDIKTTTKSSIFLTPSPPTPKIATKITKKDVVILKVAFVAIQFCRSKPKVKTVFCCHSPTQPNTTQIGLTMKLVCHPPQPPTHPPETFGPLPGYLGSWVLVCNHIRGLLQRWKEGNIP